MIPGVACAIPPQVAGFQTISFVGNAEGSTSSITDITIALPAMLESDVAYVATTCNGTTGGTMVSAGYTQLGTTLTLSTGRARMFRKVMGASPDATAVVDGDSTNTGVSAVVTVLRGVDTTTPEDVTTTTATGSSLNPNPPSITTVTPNAWVLAPACSIISDTAVVAPTGYSNQVDINTAGTGSNPTTTAMATKLVETAGVEDPATWTAWLSGAWGCFAVAVRPGPA